MLWLVFAHFIGDYGLQSQWMAENKGRNWYVLIAHGMIWTACISIALQYLGLLFPWKVVFLATEHIIVDGFKCYCLLRGGNRTWWEIYDQTWHLTQCLIVYGV